MLQEGCAGVALVRSDRLLSPRKTAVDSCITRRAQARLLKIQRWPRRYVAEVDSCGSLFHDVRCRWHYVEPKGLSSSPFRRRCGLNARSATRPHCSCVTRPGTRTRSSALRTRRLFWRLMALASASLPHPRIYRLRRPCAGTEHTSLCYTLRRLVEPASGQFAGYGAALAVRHTSIKKTDINLSRGLERVSYHPVRCRASHLMAMCAVSNTGRQTRRSH